MRTENYMGTKFWGRPAILTSMLWRWFWGRLSILTKLLFFLLSLRCRDDDSAVSNRQLDKFTTSGTKEIKYYIENLKSSDHSYTGDFQFFELPYSWNSNWCIFLPISLENSKHRLFSLAIRLAFARDMYPFNWQI